MADAMRDTLVVESRLDRVAKARRWVAQQARSAGFDPDIVSDLELVISEALANVIKHAYGGNDGHEIHLSVTSDDEKLSLTIRDFGQKFDPTTYTPPDLDNPAEGGYGVYLIQKLMDKVTYDTSLPEGTQLSMVKYRSREQDG